MNKEIQNLYAYFDEVYLPAFKAFKAAKEKYDKAMKAIGSGVPAEHFNVDNLIEEMANTKKQSDFKAKPFVHGF